MQPEIGAATAVQQEKTVEAREESAATVNKMKYPDAAATDADRGTTTEQPGAAVLLATVASQPCVTASTKSYSVAGLRLAGKGSRGEHGPSIGDVHEIDPGHHACVDGSSKSLLPCACACRNRYFGA